MSPASQNTPNVLVSRKMRAAGMPVEAIDAFTLHLRRFSSGETGTLSRHRIDPIAELDDFDALTNRGAVAAGLLPRTVVIKLNGGLGTGMGLERAKSLIEVRPGVSFLDLIVEQILDLRRRHGTEIPLLLMNSFRTADDAERVLGTHRDLVVGDLPLGFVQHRVPKIGADGAPAEWPPDPDLEWCPPGHGDLFTAVGTSRVLDQLLERGYEFAFVSNSDNLGAALDPLLLAYIADRGADFVMEVADRTPVDRKGGHLCRRTDGRLALRESAQCPPDEIEEFQDINRYRYFNTNNLWFSLPALAALLRRHRGALPLDTIVNHKTIDPRDPSSPPVVQLETAMGAAISLFDDATAIRVPRHRFSPVKNTTDLLAVRSDAYALTEDRRLVLAGERSGPPTVRLDPQFYRRIDDFDLRFPSGPPSLIGCHSLTIEGDVTFGEGVVIEGDVTIRGSEEPSRIPDGAVLRGEHRA